MADLDDLEIGPDASDLAEPAPKGPFMPAPDDRSYLANAYRELFKALLWAQGRIHSDICTRQKCVRECEEADVVLGKK